MLGDKTPSRLPSVDPDIELPHLEAQHKLDRVRNTTASSSSSPSSFSGPSLGDVPDPLPGSKDTGGRFPKVFRFIIGNWDRLLLLSILVALVVLVSVKGLSVFGEILRWFQAQNNWFGWLSFLGLYCLNVALFLPGIVLIAGAGFVFGFGWGFLAVWIGGGIGQALAFLLARYLVQDSVSVLVKGKWRKWEIIDLAIEQEGWILLVLLRFSVVPYNLLNITMAATKIRFWAFAIASFFGIIPECALLCYMGSLATSITDVISGDAGPGAATTYALAGITIVLLICSATWATIFVRRAMRRAEAQLRGEDGDPEVGDHSDAGNDPRLLHGLAPHRLQEDYVATCLEGTARAPAAPRDLGRPSPLLRTAALVAIPGLGSPGATRALMSEALRGSIRDRRPRPGGEDGAEEGSGLLQSLRD